MAGNAYTNPWDAARLRQLIALFEAGLSAGQIAKKMGFTSRNAVIGKLSRLRRQQVIGPSKNPPCRRASGPAPAQVVATYPPRPAAPARPPRAYVKRVAPASHPEPGGEHAGALLDIGPNGCRWIEASFVHGAGASQAMCGAQVKTEGKAYCAHHHALAYWPESMAESRRRQEKLTRTAVYFDRRR